MSVAWRCRACGRRAGAILLSLLTLGAAPLPATPTTAPLEGADPAHFPLPPSLHHAADFWRRVYTEIETSQGFLHDSRHLQVVYETVEIGEGVGYRQRSRIVQRRVSHYRRILEKLAGGRRAGLSDEESRVLALFPADVSAATLASAARSVRFQLGQADRFREGLARSGIWLAHIRAELAALGVPEDLAYLPHVESSFNPVAHSHAAAVGLWQFTRPTGRRFMRIDHVVDERLDPWIASAAAARLLAENYQDLGEWPLAVTAYNHGVAGMQRARAKLGTTDMGIIAERYDGRTFGFASRNFYPSFLAAVHVHKFAEQYFGEVPAQGAEAYVTVALDDFVPAASVADALGVDLETLEALNPALRWPVWQGDKHIPRGYRLRLPPEMPRERALAALGAVPAAQRFAFQTPDYSHRVARGETLSGIATRYGVSARAIAELNGLRSAHFIRIGQELKLPVREGAQAHNPPAPTTLAAATTATGDDAAAATPTDGAIMTAPGASYRVRRGDSLSLIARRVGVSTQALMAANRLPDAHFIREGQMLVIPGAGDPGDAWVPEVYTVQRGDSIWELARRFGVRGSQIAALNGLDEGGRIYIGQQLRLLPEGMQGGN